MQRTEVVAGQLLGLAEKLRERGQEDLALEVTAFAQTLRAPRVPEPPGGVMTTGEAARILGVRSVNTIKRWVREGLLVGFRRGGRILLSRESVHQMAGSAAVADARAAEQEQDAVLAAFDGGENERLPTEWHGRRPWQRAGAPAEPARA